MRSHHGPKMDSSDSLASPERSAVEQRASADEQRELPLREPHVAPQLGERAPGEPPLEDAQAAAVPRVTISRSRLKRAGFVGVELRCETGTMAPWCGTPPPRARTPPPARTVHLHLHT